MARPPRALVFVWIATVLVFGPALRGEYVDDDLDLIAQNPVFGGLGHLIDALRLPFWGFDLGYWRPLTSALMCVGHAVGNGHPWPIHLIALLVHLGAVTTVFAIVRRFGTNDVPAALAAALFALHPCQVESVAWVAALGDPVCGAGTLLAILGHVRWRERGGIGLPFLAWGGALLALAAKETGIATFAWLLAVDVATRRRWPVPRSRWLLAWTGPIVLLAVWYWLRTIVFGDAAAGFDRGKLDLGIAGTDRISIGAFVGTSLLALPSGWLDITPYRWMPASGDAAWAALPLRLLVLPAAAIAVVAAARRQRELAWSCGLGALASIAPVALVPASLGPWPIVDRYAYTTVFAFAGVLLGCGATRPRLGLALVAVSAVHSALTVPLWRTHEAVVQRALRDCPWHPEAWYLAGNLARAAADREPQDEAHRATILQHSREALAAYECARAAMQRPLHARAHLVRMFGVRLELGEALVALSSSLRPPEQIARALDDTARRYPNDATVQLARGAAAVSMGNAQRAEGAWLRALELDPTNDQAAFNLGRLYFELRRFPAARERLQQALSFNPNNAAARAFLDRLPR